MGRREVKKSTMFSGRRTTDSSGGMIAASFFFLCLSLFVGCRTHSAPADKFESAANPPSKKVLIIGNSYVDLNGGIDAQLRGLTPKTEASRISPGGFTLKLHWSNANTLNAIRTGKWDVVVLQEQSLGAVTNRPDFFLYAQKLDEEIKKAGAETVLLMTWERPDSVQFGVTTAMLSEAYTALGKELGAKVAPAGLAFSEALRERPQLGLNIADGHPTRQGTYLAACVLYATIFNQSPVGNSYSAGLNDDERELLQHIAAQTLGL